jgi:putative endopeptidase
MVVMHHSLRGLPLKAVSALLACTPLWVSAIDANLVNLSPVIERSTRAASVLPVGPLGYSPSHMDKSVSPRKDFYAYATGNWLNSLNIPDSETDIGGFALLKTALKHQLLNITMRAGQGGYAKGSPEQQVGDYYRAAMNTARQDQLGLDPLKIDLVQGQAASSPVDLARFSADQLKKGGAPLLIGWPVTDIKDNTRMVLALMPGGPQLEQTQYTDPTAQRIRDLYLDYITRMLRQTGESDDVAAQHAKSILAMEAELMAPRLTPLQARDPARTYNLMTLAEAQALIPAVDLGEFLKQIGVEPTARIQIHDLEGMKTLNRLLSTRPKEDLQTLVRWSVLSASAGFLGQPWYGMADEYQRKRDQLVRSEPREEQTVDAIATQLFHPLSQLYVKTYFPESTRREVTEMVGHIRQEFETRLRSNPWLDEPTRKAALEKLARVDIQVGYPKSWIDFSSIDIRADDHLGNNQRIAAFNLKRELDKLPLPVKVERFNSPKYTTPTAVNAAYNPTYNGIDITAAIVQPPFYTPGADMAVNYCTIGAVIGHELTHGFDSNGSRYDAVGNLRNWWTPQASNEFKQRTQLLVDQFDSYKVLPDMVQSGNLTLTENTADLGGITLAHAALNRALKGKQLPKVDGLTTDQRCFVAWAQLWTYKARTERVRLLAATDFHALGFLRGFGPLRNMDAFHKAFGTKPGDPMWLEPAKRARIW